MKGNISVNTIIIIITVSLIIYRYCGYVVDNGDNNFLMHGFIVEPCADRLCLALLHACQARYQRVLDAHLSEGDTGNIDSYTVSYNSNNYTVIIIINNDTVCIQTIFCYFVVET